MAGGWQPETRRKLVRLGVGQRARRAARVVLGVAAGAVVALACRWTVPRLVQHRAQPTMMAAVTGVGLRVVYLPLRAGDQPRFQAALIAAHRAEADARRSEVAAQRAADLPESPARLRERALAQTLEYRAEQEVGLANAQDDFLPAEPEQVATAAVAVSLARSALGSPNL